MIAMVPPLSTFETKVSGSWPRATRTSKTLGEPVSDLRWGQSASNRESPAFRRGEYQGESWEGESALGLDDPCTVPIHDHVHGDRVKTNQGVGRESSPHTYSLRFPVARYSRPPHTDRRRGRPTDRRTLLTATRRGFQARASGSKVTIDVGNPACSRFDGTRPAPCDFILTRLPHADSFCFRVTTLPRCRSKHVGSFPRGLSA